MTENEAIERIKTMAFMCDDFHNCKYGHDCTDGCSEAVKMAVDALQGSIKKHIGKDNMVISSSDLMTILNSDSEELKKYKEVGTVEEFKALKEENSELHNEAQAERAFLTERDAEIRANAIDEFASAILQKFTEEGRNGNYRFYSCKIKQVITDLAEQLKGGAV